MHSDAKTVSEYIASLEGERKQAISAIRAAMKEQLPAGYEEVMRWGMITYEVPLSVKPNTYNKKPLMYAAIGNQKNHIGVYLSAVYQDSELRDSFIKNFEATGKKLDMGKSCVRLRSLEATPLAVIGEAIAAVPMKDFIAQYERMHES